MVNLFQGRTEKAGFCVGSAPGKIYVNGLTDNRYAMFKYRTISVCCVYLKDGGYKLSSMLPYVSGGITWGTATGTGTTVSPVGYLNGTQGLGDGVVFDAESFWNAVVVANGNVEPDRVSVIIPFTTGLTDACAGAGETVNLTIEITKN
ncbi:MAG: hypothetical protein ACK5IQ_09135 [Bacteroidales bacterium]